MTTYLYKVKNADGSIYWGLEEAFNLKELKKQLSSNEYFFLSAEVYNLSNLNKIRLKLDDLLLFTHRLSYLIDSGLPIIQCLFILWKQSNQKEMQIILSYLKKRLEAGATLQEAFYAFPKVFPAMYLALIGVAEIGAGLVKILKKLGQYIDDQKKFRLRVKRATTYPIFVISFAFLVVICLFMFVVPTFEKVIHKLHGEIPYLTQLIFGVSSLLRNPIFIAFMFLFVLGSLFLWKYLKKFEQFNFTVDSWKLKAPVFNKVIYPLTVGRFTRSLALLIESGVPLLLALDVAKATVVNKRIEKAVESVIKQVREGGTLYEAFKATKIFPVILVDMVGIGETSGKLHYLLENMANYLEEEADHALNKFLTYLEPILIITIGVIILFVLLGIYLPIFSIQNTLRVM